MSKKYKRALVWLRRDLRWKDHRTFWEAFQNAEKVAAVFVFDVNILLKLKNRADQRVSFIFDSLVELKKLLEERGGDLIIRYGDPVCEIPEVVERLSIEAVFTGRDFEKYAIQRDKNVHLVLEKKQVDFHSIVDQVIFHGKEISKDNGDPYRVFTPYKNRWLKELTAERIKKYTVKNEHWISQKETDRLNQVKEMEDIEFSYRKPSLLAGEKAAYKRGLKFVNRIKSYDSARDFPADHGTSMLSPYLRFGNVSIRGAVRLALKGRSKGERTWLSELIWREFYQMILTEFPYVESGSFKKDCDKIKWPGRSHHFKAWCEGRTGFPIVDASMRDLVTTGQMPNRCRMIVASFLVKDLLIDWRRGADFFAEHLLDFDLSANNGGWQWAASTGCDAQPYFRVFNPWLQSRKFDSEGEYIKQHIPELAHLNAKALHQPIVNHETYPEPIIDHAEQKDRAIRLFKEL